jgi:hypothetical protein
MDVREKLVEIIQNSVGGCARHWAEVIADGLIAHGVTVQEEAKLYWKPVKPGEWNLTCSACDSHLGCREGAKYCPECGAKFVYPKAAMPQPPKGE